MALRRSRSRSGTGARICFYQKWYLEMEETLDLKANYESARDSKAAPRSAGIVKLACATHRSLKVLEQVARVIASPLRSAEELVLVFRLWVVVA